MIDTSNRTFGATLLIAGTAIGAGMLALPAVTATYGFLPSLILFVVSWMVMTLAAFVMLEANLWFASDANLISMSKQTLGKWGETIAWLAYLLLLYSLMTAYLSGMNALLISAIDALFHTRLQPLGGSLLLIGLFGIIIYLGAATIDYLNRLLMLGLIASYLILIFLLSPSIQIERLTAFNFNQMWLAIPVIVTSFGFQIIIPSLRAYLESDFKKLRFAILLGSVVPLIVYLIWELNVLGVLPLEGVNGLKQIEATGQPATGLTLALEKVLANRAIGTTMSFFAFYAIATSFIGVSFSLFDFLADGFHIPKNKLGRFLTALITFIPPFIFSFSYPRAFILALGFAGVFVAVLLIILPVCIVISGRYVHKFSSEYRVKGGLATLVFLLFAASIIIITELIPGSYNI